MDIVLFDTPERKKLFPLTRTRAVADIRMGIFTIKERWERLTKKTVHIITVPSLQPLYGPVAPGDYIFIDASVQPTFELVETVLALSEGECVCENERIVAGRSQVQEPTNCYESPNGLFSNRRHTSPQKWLQYPFQIFQRNEELIRFDYSILDRHSYNVSKRESVVLRNSDQIFIEEGVELDSCVLNASSGPIYIGKNATIMEGSTIRGPFVLGEGATIKMGARIYGATTVGPYSVVGGEVKNAVFFGFSNKAHEGYLGDSVIGEWCNLGAGTTNSNIKNTAAKVKVWNYFDNAYAEAGMKCGVIMGDYSRTAINTSINTGTVIGVSCNVFGTGLTPALIPDFTWGMNIQSQYLLGNALRDISNWKKLKNRLLEQREEDMLRHIFDTTE